MRKNCKSNIKHLLLDKEISKWQSNITRGPIQPQAFHEPSPTFQVFSFRNCKSNGK